MSLSPQKQSYAPIHCESNAERIQMSFWIHGFLEGLFLRNLVDFAENEVFMYLSYKLNVFFVSQQLFQQNLAKWDSIQFVCYREETYPKMTSIAPVDLEIRPFKVDLRTKFEGSTKIRRLDENRRFGENEYVQIFCVISNSCRHCRSGQFDGSRRYGGRRRRTWGSSVCHTPPGIRQDGHQRLLRRLGVLFRR